LIVVCASPAASGAYLVASITVNDAERFKDYSDHTPPMIASYGGEYLARGTATHCLEGVPPRERVVLVRFPSLEKAQAWYESEEYQALLPVRLEASDGDLYIVEGID
jgi:uncharacterized protein (DUF1330 family)